jgi:hypothetical protein
MFVRYDKRFFLIRIRIGRVKAEMAPAAAVFQIRPDEAQKPGEGNGPYGGTVSRYG